MIAGEKKKIIIIKKRRHNENNRKCSVCERGHKEDQKKQEAETQREESSVLFLSLLLTLRTMGLARLFTGTSAPAWLLTAMLTVSGGGGRWWNKQSESCKAQI
jgi:hypothetical protein